MKKRRDEFVVGGPNQWEPVWGPEKGNCGENCLRPVTALGATRLLREYEDAVDEKGLIYRLVPVSLAAVKTQAARERKTKKGKA